jgi:AcrR family transcriptional regulator
MRVAAREKIIDAGLRLFSHKGLAATSIQEIAALAGISVGLVYHYYKSKEDLFSELVETIVDSGAESTGALFGSDLTPVEKVRVFSKDVIDSIGQSDHMSQFYLLMTHYLLAVDMPDKLARVQDKGFAPVEVVTQTIVEGQASGEIKAGDPQQMAVMYFAAIQGIAIAKLTMADRFVLPNPELLNDILLTPGKHKA